jgi:vitamin B12 transporter
MSGKRQFVCLLLWLGWGMGLYAQPEDSLPTHDLESVLIRANPIYSIDSLHGSSAWTASAWALQNTSTASPAELLTANPSVFVKQYAPGGLATLALRGTGAGHTQVFWHGVPVNSPLLGQGDLSLGSAGTLGGPRLVYGGASLSLGSGGLGGAMSFADPIQTGVAAAAEYGSFQSWRGTARLGHKKGRHFAGAALAAQGAENDFPYTQLALPGQPDVRQEHAATQQYSAALDGGVRPRGGNHRIEANGYAQFAARQLPPTMLTTNLTESQQDYAVRGRLAWDMGIRRVGSVNTAAAITHEGLNYENVQAGIDAPSAFTRLHLRSDFLYRHRRSLLRGAGLQVQRDAVSAEGIPGDKTRNLASAYLAFHAHHRDRLHADLILRQERTDSLWSPLLGYCGLVWNLPLPRYAYPYGQKSSFRLLANLSRNYRLPTLNDLYWQPGGNAQLAPEHSIAGEFKLLGETPLADTLGQVTYSVATFANRIDGWILWTPGNTGIWTPENLGRVWARGGEAQVAADLRLATWRLHLETAYTFTRSTNERAKSAADSSVGKQLIYTPLHNWRGILGFQRGDWQLSYQQSLTGRRYISTDNQSWLPAFHTGDLALTWRHRLGRAHSPFYPTHYVNSYSMPATILSVRLLAANLWDVQYQTIAWRPMPGRNISLRLQFEW